MRRPISAPVLAVLLALALGSTPFITAAAADTPSNGNTSGDLTVRANGFTHTRGHAVAKLFITGDNVLEAGR